MAVKKETAEWRLIAHRVEYDDVQEKVVAQDLPHKLPDSLHQAASGSFYDYEGEMRMYEFGEGAVADKSFCKRVIHG